MGVVVVACVWDLLDGMIEDEVGCQIVSILDFRGWVCFK